MGRNVFATPCGFDPAITSLSGTGATGLAGVATVGRSAGDQWLVSISGKLMQYQLHSGNDATAVPLVIQPADNGTSNLVWKLTSVQANAVSTQSVLLLHDNSNGHVLDPTNAAGKGYLTIYLPSTGGNLALCSGTDGQITWGDISGTSMSVTTGTFTNCTVNDAFDCQASIIILNDPAAWQSALGMEPATAQPNSAASDVPGIVADFNTLLGNLRTAGLLNT